MSGSRRSIAESLAGETAESSWADRIRHELVDGILPFWVCHTIDRRHGGFHGAIDSELRVVEGAPRTSVVNARILWTFSAATRLLGPAYRETADWAHRYLVDRFWDRSQGGLYWTLDDRGEPLSARKQTYGQAFAIYGFAEYHRATGTAASLELAKRLFRLLEEHGHDRTFKGYLEALGREWQPLDDMRLSDKDPNCAKSMNTHLHVVEAYANLLRVWRDPLLANRQVELVDLFLDQIADRAAGHLRLFFDGRWNPLSDHVSYGHDIEASWLLVEAAEVLGDDRLLKRTRELAVAIAGAVLDRGLDDDGSVFFEADGAGVLVDARKHWWVQAEAVVGFHNAYEVSGDEKFLAASRRVWDYIESKVIDRERGEWHAKLSRDGVPLTAAEDPDALPVGPWKCPYHNGRACMEMLRRLERRRLAR